MDARSCDRDPDQTFMDVRRCDRDPDQTFLDARRCDRDVDRTVERRLRIPDLIGFRLTFEIIMSYAVQKVTVTWVR